MKICLLVVTIIGLNAIATCKEITDRHVYKNNQEPIINWFKRRQAPPDSGISLFNERQEPGISLFNERQEPGISLFNERQEPGISLFNERQGPGISLFNDRQAPPGASISLSNERQARSNTGISLFKKRHIFSDADFNNLKRRQDPLISWFEERQESEDPLISWFNERHNPLFSEFNVRHDPTATSHKEEEEDKNIPGLSLFKREFRSNAKLSKTNYHPQLRLKGSTHFKGILSAKRNDKLSVSQKRDGYNKKFNTEKLHHSSNILKSKA
ncbi:uncharacterized protein TRIADDRAFT_51274 [Trichoplax adhaerens]|uniref:Uncharacterized protein n=1 Tax=Trichoplax adhaerens TaxID=10228 RepID=B3RI57_TRIAD|nr:predicted protein [Trichoplax adhaerens]EDV29212.1 predicted protein [Trichoplax adhaerens]|eukprot:XP_002108414.1 predicted protein [Trichoplax adhaerens]